MSQLTPADRNLPAAAEGPERLPVLRSSLTPGSDSRGEGIPLRDYVEALRRYVWLVAAAVLVSVGLAAYRLNQELPRYAASSSVRLVERNLKMAGDLSSTGGEQVGNAGWYTDPMLSQIQVLKSRAVAGEAVDSLGYRLCPDRPDFPYVALGQVKVSSAARDGDTLRLVFGGREVTARSGAQEVKAAYGQPFDVAGVRMTVAQKPGDMADARFTIIPRDDAVMALLGGIDARPREMTDMLDVVYTAYDPHLAQRVVDAVAGAFQRQNTEAAQEKSRRRRLFIQEQLKSTDSLLVSAQYQLSAFRKSVQAFSPREKFKAAEEDLSEFRVRREDLALEKGIYDRMYQELSRDRGREGAEEIAALAASPQVASNGGIVRLYDQLIRYQTLRDSVTTGQWSRSATNPDVQRLDSLMSTSKSRLLRAVESRGIALAAQIDVLDRLMASDAERIRELPDAEAEEGRLGREVETLQTLVDDLLRERQKARIDEAVEQGTVEIVDQALLPMGPIGRGTKRRILFALLVGLMIGGGGALVLDRMNTALQRREDVETYLHVPTLGIIPRVVPAGEAAGKKKLKIPGVSLSRRRPAAGEGLLTAADLHSPASQAYRKLRTHLIFTGAGAQVKTLMVTSPAASEGKSTVSSNLAVTFAQQHLRVALVDGDLRRSRLHHLFGVERVPGLTEVLSGQAALEDVFRPSGIEGLTLVPAGTLVPNVSELLGSGGMRAALARLGELFDIVIVDTPPVLAAADAEILGGQADAALLVVRAGSTERQSAQYAVQQMRAIGVRLVGAVLNDPDEKLAAYGRYAYYYDYYTEKV